MYHTILLTFTAVNLVSAIVIFQLMHRLAQCGVMP